MADQECVGSGLEGNVSTFIRGKITNEEMVLSLDSASSFNLINLKLVERLVGIEIKQVFSYQLSAAFGKIFCSKDGVDLEVELGVQELKVE